MPDLSASKLFSKISPEKLVPLLKLISLYAKNYVQGEIIAFEGDACTSIGIVTQGEISIYQLLPSGKKIIIDTLYKGDSFGEVIIFSEQNTYPASIEAGKPTQIIFINKENVTKLCSISQEFLSQFAGLLSNKILMLNRKVKSLSLQSPRLKTINFILESYRQQNTLLLHFAESRNDMAEKLSLPRPSLSRELIKMKVYGWIDFDGNTIKIINLDALENELNERSN